MSFLNPSSQADIRPILPDGQSPRGLGTFLLLCALGGIVGAMIKPFDERHSDITVGIAGYMAIVAAIRIWAWLKAGNAERALSRRNFEGALDRANRALALFEQHPWLDQGRAAALGEMGIIPLTEQAHSHRVAALANLGRRQDAQAALKEMEAAFPDGIGTGATRDFLHRFRPRKD